jgi:hypothetical protein
MAYFFKCGFSLACILRQPVFGSRVLFAAAFPRAPSVGLGILRFACVPEYSRVGVMRFAFVSPKYFGCGVRFAFARSASARFKGFGRISSRCNRNKQTPA